MKRSTVKNPDAAEMAATRDLLLARAHREACAELDVLIPWASPAIVRELQRRYRRAFNWPRKGRGYT